MMSTLGGGRGYLKSRREYRGRFRSRAQSHFLTQSHFLLKSEPHCGMTQSQSWLILGFCSLLLLKGVPKMRLDLKLTLYSVSVYELAEK